MVMTISYKKTQYTYLTISKRTMYSVKNQLLKTVTNPNIIQQRSMGVLRCFKRKANSVSHTLNPKYKGKFHHPENVHTICPKDGCKADNIENQKFCRAICEPLKDENEYQHEVLNHITKNPDPNLSKEEKDQILRISLISNKSIDGKERPTYGLFYKITHKLIWANDVALVDWGCTGYINKNDKSIINGISPMNSSSTEIAKIINPRLPPTAYRAPSTDFIIIKL
jgi:hypothetical protein